MQVSTAATVGREEVALRFLLEHGAKMELEDEDGCTSLFFAVGVGGFWSEDHHEVTIGRSPGAVRVID